MATNHINNYWRMVGLGWDDSLLFHSEVFSGLVWIYHMLLNILPFPKTSNKSWLPALDWLRCQGYKSLVGQLPSPQKTVVRHIRYHGLTCTSLAFLMAAAVPFIFVLWPFHIAETFHVAATVSSQPCPEGATAAPSYTRQEGTREVQFSPPSKAWHSGTMPWAVCSKAGLATPLPLKGKYAQTQESVLVPLPLVPIVYDVFITL